jgi:hypothetical protein
MNGVVLLSFVGVAGVLTLIGLRFGLISLRLSTERGMM